MKSGKKTHRARWAELVLVIGTGLTLAGVGLAQTPAGQAWTNAEGKSMRAAFLDLQQGLVKVRLANGKTHALPLEDLSWESAQQAIQLKWKPGGVAELRLLTPDRIGLSNVDIQRAGEKEVGANPPAPGWIRYRTRHFEFDSEQELTPAFLKRAGLVFESTRLLLHQLPWRIEAQPLKGDLFLAKIYKSDETYFASGGPVGSAGVFVPSTGEFSLPWQGEGRNLDTMQHEIAHQMMQRILPVMPWWVAEGTAEYISIMKYQNGYFACNMVSSRQVTPELERCARLVDAGGSVVEVFQSAMEYRGETSAEAVMEHYSADGERRVKAMKDFFVMQIAHVKDQLAPLEDRREMFARMFALPHGQSCTVDLKPPQKPQPVAAQAARQESSTLRTMVPLGGNLEMSQRYAAATLLVYHLTALAPDKGEGFARYMWGLQQLRDEYDLSHRLLEKERTGFSKAVEALNPVVKEMNAKAQDYARQLGTYLRKAAAYAENHGRLAATKSGTMEFTHLPEEKSKVPVPPPVLELNPPPLPAAPAARLSSAQLRERREALLKELTKGRTPGHLVEEARKSFAKKGVAF